MTNEAVLPAPLGVALDAAELEPSRRLAWAALLDVTPASELGELIAVVPEEDEGVYTLQYTTRLPGYPDWRWNVSLVRLADRAEPTVLEAELLPGDGALLAPSWVPWSDRLADYEAAQLLEAGESVEGSDESDEATGEEAAPRSSKRIRRTRTRRRIGADGAAEVESIEPETAESESESESAPASVDDAPADTEKPKKKKRKKDKSAKKAKSEVATESQVDESVAVKGGKDDSDTSLADATPVAEKPKKSRRKRVEQTTPAAADGEQPEEAAAESAGGASVQKPERRKRKKAAKVAEAAPIETVDPVETVQVDDVASDAAPVKAGARGKRRRVVVVPRSEDELPAQEPAEFGEAADFREFADDMDDVFDGVDFEPEMGPDAANTDKNTDK